MSTDKNDRFILLGIDPSFSNMGAAVYNTDYKKLLMKTGDFHQVLEWLKHNCKMKEVIAVVENPALNSTVFGVYGIIEKTVLRLIKYQLWSVRGRKGPIPEKTTMADLRSDFLICMNYAQKVGENKAAAKLIIKMLHQKGVPVLEVAPSKRQKAYKTVTKKVNGKMKKIRQNKDVRFLILPTKTDRDQFATITGITDRTSEHARDAATLVYNRTASSVLKLIEIEELKNKNKPVTYPSSKNNNEFILNKEVQKQKT